MISRPRRTIRTAVTHEFDFFHAEYPFLYLTDFPVWAACSPTYLL
jgi:hypothetical protein